MNNTKNKKTTKLVALILSAVLLLSALGTILFFCISGNGGGETPGGENESDNSNFNTVVGKFTDREIKTGESAILAVQDIAGDLGLINAAEELSVKSENTVDNLTYYRLQQNYNGIPVYGSTFVVVTDENGEAKGLTGNAADISDDISLTPTVTQEQVEESIRAYVGEDVEISVPELSDDMLVIYNYEDVEKATLAYEAYISVNGVQYISIVNALDSIVIKMLSTEYYDSDEIANNNRNIYIYDANKAIVNKGRLVYDTNGNVYKHSIGSSDWYNANGEKVYLSSDGYSFLNSEDELVGIYDETQGESLFIYNRNLEDSFATGKTDNATAVEVYALVSRTDLFFRSEFEINGHDNNNGNVFIVVNCSFKTDSGALTGNNASSSGYFSLKGTVLSFGHAQKIEKDVIAHEYTHSVERKISNMQYEGESGAIKEGYSDLFGELFEDYDSDGQLDGKGCNWEHGTVNIRSLENPSAYTHRVCSNEFLGVACSHNFGGLCRIDMSYPASINDSTFCTSEIYDEGGVHHNSTVISYAAYLMTQNKFGTTALTTDELAHLWYNTLFVLPSNCTFNAFRQNMLMVAKSMNYTDKQIKRISSAFDEVGIDGMDGGSKAWETYGTNPTLQVYGNNMELYGNYTVDVNKFGDDKSEDNHIKVQNTEPVQLTMSAGRYTITVKDAANTNNSEFKNIIIVDDSESEEKEDRTIFFATTFGSDIEHTHSYTTSTQEATCTAPGWEKQVCSCGDVQSEKELSIIDHNYVDGKCSMCQKTSGGSNLTFDVSVELKNLVYIDDKTAEITYSIKNVGTNAVRSVEAEFKIDGIGGRSAEWFMYLSPGDEITDTDEVTVDKNKTISWSVNVLVYNKSSALDFDETTNVDPNLDNNRLVVDVAPYDNSKYSEGLTFALNSDKKSYSVTGIGTCTDTDIVIPSVYEGLPVTSIGKSAFNDNSNIISVRISNNIISIGSGAFSNCTNLKNVFLGNRLTTIGHSAFYNCDSLTEIIIPASVKIIESPSSAWYEYGAFASCKNLSKLTFGDSNTQTVLSEIGDEAFLESGLEVVFIGNGVGTIGNYVFKGCTKLSSVTLGSSLTSIQSHAFDNCKTLSDIVFPNSLVTIGGCAFNNCDSLKSIEIPDSVETIGVCAFESCNSLENVTIGKSVTDIGKKAFYGCNISDLKLGASVVKIGQSAFACTNLKSVEIPANAIKIGENAFGSSYLISIYITDLKAWCSIQFEGPSFYMNELYLDGTLIKSLSLPNDISTISNYAFYECKSIEEINIPKAVSSIGTNAFRDCSNLKTINYAGTQTEWDAIEKAGNWDLYTGNYIINFLPDESSNISSEGLSFELNGDGKGYTLIGIGSCKDSDIVIPSTYQGLPVTAIGENAFTETFNALTGGVCLTSVVMPSSIKTIGMGAFMDCYELEVIYYDGTCTEWGNINIGAVAFWSTSCQIVCTDGTVNY